VLVAVIPPANPTQGKPAVRAAALAARDALPADERAAKSRAIAANVDAAVFAALPAGAVVALYAPKASEVDTAELAARAAVRGLAVAYPRVVKGSRVLAFHLATADHLVGGVFGLREPPADAPVVPIERIAAIVVPGVAFDATGRRLGWGRGHYDATLARAPSLTTVGVAYRCQLLPRVPADATDVPVRLVITEDGIVRAP
jgi:5-formyltetrahydrofolate cyclo-ligase